MVKVKMLEDKLQIREESAAWGGEIDVLQIGSKL
jgi:hypothetical protein